MKTKYKFYLLIPLICFFLSGLLHSQSDSIMTLDAKGSFNLSGIGYSPDGLKIAAGYSLKIIIWDALKGNPIDTLNEVEGRNLTVRYSYDGSMIVCNGDSTPQLWDANSGELLKTLPGKPLNDWDSMSGAAFSHDDKKIIGGNTDRTLSIWDVSSHELIKKFKAHDDMIFDAVFTLDDSKIISCSSDSTIKIWDANTYSLLKTLKGHKDKVIRVVMSPDGKKFASCSSDSTIKLWNIDTGELIKTFYGHNNYVFSIVFSPNGTKLLSGSYDETVKLWDVVSGDLLHTFEHNTPVFCVRYSPDSLKVASAGLFEKIIIWKVPGITDVEEQVYLSREDFIISPNPATVYIEININNVMPAQAGIHDLSVKVFDVLGNVVVSESFTHPPTPSREGEKVRLDISALAPGVYFVKVGGQVSKFVKM